MFQFTIDPNIIKIKKYAICLDNSLPQNSCTFSFEAVSTLSERCQVCTQRRPEINRLLGINVNFSRSTGPQVVGDERVFISTLSVKVYYPHSFRYASYRTNARLLPNFTKENIYMYRQEVIHSLTSPTFAQNF